jgi:hypothetical protein
MRRSFTRTNRTRFAFDAMPDDKAAELLLFLKSRLSEEDFNEACRLGKLDSGITGDEPAPYSGMRKPAVNFGQDARRRPLDITCSAEEFAKLHPSAAKIVVNR